MLEKLYKLIFGSKFLKTTSINLEKPIEYWINDPSTPELKASKVFSNTKLPINVVGFEGGGYPINSSQGRAGNCYATMHNTMEYIFKLNNPPKNWFINKELTVYPLAGQDFNAFYDRKSVRFFYGYDPTIRENIYTSESSEIISHELGHAILDSIRPDFWNIQSYEVWALHESFGDIISILNITSNKDVLNVALKETSGDLFKSNFVTKLAEQMARSIVNITGGKKGHNPTFLRDAANSFIYQSPENLPDNALDSQLSRECHSFSRVWTAAWYECLIEVYKFNIDNYKMQNVEAFYSARDTMANYFLDSVRQVPLTNRLFEALAQKMIIEDKNNGSKYGQLLKKVFMKRNIISLVAQNDFSINKDKKFLKIKSNGKNIFKDYEPIKTLKISDYFEKRELVNKDLYGVEIQIPYEDRYETSGISMQFRTMNNIQENANIALMCINSLSKDKTINELFKIENNKLIRKKIIN